MIKGLYFKLNVGNPRDKFIYNFFKMQSEAEKIDKIALLDKMITLYINAENRLEDEQ